MSLNPTNIEWTHVPGHGTGFTCNPLFGCLHDCEYCYAKGLAKRRGKQWGLDPADPFKPVFFPKRLRSLLKRKAPCTVFLGSMADVFGRWDWECVQNVDVVLPAIDGQPLMVWKLRKGMWIDAVCFWSAMLRIIRTTPHILYQVLTKDPENAYNVLSQLTDTLPQNLWIGTTVNNQEDADWRIPELLKLRTLFARCLFVSHEPALEYAHPHRDLDWWIIGDQTDGPRSLGKMDPVDIAAEVKIARTLGIPVFVKHNVKVAHPEGRPWPKQFPEVV